MSRVCSSGNKATEKRLIKIFRENKIKGWRRKCPLPGKPDFVFPKERIAVFVDGCFWHGCPLHYSAPATRKKFWKDKLRRNVLRDLEADDELSSQGWIIYRIWQHDLNRINKIILDIFQILKKTDRQFHSNTFAAQDISEPISQYGNKVIDMANQTSWWICSCGRMDVRVLSVNKPGSLRPNSKKHPDYAELICCICRKVWVTSCCGS